MKKRCTSETVEFSIDKKKTGKRFGQKRRGLFFSVFAVSLITALSVIAAAVIDYRGRAAAQGSGGSILAFSHTETGAAQITVLGNNYCLDGDGVKSAENILTRTGTCVSRCIPLFIKSPIKQRTDLCKTVINVIKACYK